jgi:CheY-like chemotaxis protein
VTAGRTFRVVLVDDSVDDIYLIRYALERTENTVETEVAESVPDALDLLRSRPPSPIDLMLLDLNLPGASGFELLYAFQNEPTLRPNHVTVMTSSTLEEDRILASDLGADGFLAKPSRFDDLVDMLATLLQKLEPRA